MTIHTRRETRKPLTSERKVHDPSGVCHAAGHARIVARAKLPTSFGEFRVFGIEGTDSKINAAHANGTMPLRKRRTRAKAADALESAVALVHGRISAEQAPLVRIHSQCLTGDVFHSQRCDCRAQLEMALRETARASAGIVFYLPQEGRGIGLMNKLRAYALQDAGLDTVEANRKLGFAADHRDYRFCAEALKLLGVRAVRLLTNNPEKVQQLEREGIRVIERVPCQPDTSRHTRAYLRTKKKKMGHLLEGF